MLFIFRNLRPLGLFLSLSRWRFLPRRWLIMLMRCICMVVCTAFFLFKRGFFLFTLPSHILLHLRGHILNIHILHHNIQSLLKSRILLHQNRKHLRILLKHLKLLHKRRVFQVLSCLRIHSQLHHYFCCEIVEKPIFFTTLSSLFFLYFL